MFSIFRGDLIVLYMHLCETVLYSTHHTTKALASPGQNNWRNN